MQRSVPARLLLPAFAAAALALPARANDLYWNRTDANWYNWSDPANWTDTSGNAVYAAPDAVDTIADHARAEKMNVDLGNGTVTIIDWTWTDNAHNDAVAIRNGALAVTGQSTFRQATVDLYDASFSTVDGEFAYNWGGHATINVHDGSTFTVSGKFWPRIMNVNVDAGGTFVYASTAVAQNCNYNNDFVVANSGLCDWPDGFRHFSNAWSFRPYFKQLAGEWRLGGDVTYQNNLFWRIELTGGKVSATGDVSFDIHADNASAFAKFTDGADVELAVASGKTLDLSNFAYENAAAVAKTGAEAARPSVDAPLARGRDRLHGVDADGVRRDRDRRRRHVPGAAGEHDDRHARGQQGHARDLEARPDGLVRRGGRDALRLRDGGPR